MGNWFEQILVTTAVVLMASPPAGAQSVPQIAINACSTAATKKVKSQYDGASKIEVGGQSTDQISSTQRAVKGDGSFDRKGKHQKFTFTCTFDMASGSTKDTEIRLRDSSSKSAKSDDATKALLGLAVGALIAGAIANSASDRDKAPKDPMDWWSPTNGVKCSPKLSECYSNAKYDAKWTQKVYGK